MATPYRCTVTIDGNKFDAVSTNFKMSTATDNNNLPKMGSFGSSVWVYADFHDTKNVPFGVMQSIFNLANVVTRDKIKSMKIEYWKDENKQDALGAVQFSGWVSYFEASNLNTNTIDNTYLDEPENDVYTSGVPQILNHMLAVELVPALNQQYYSDLQFTN